MRPTYFVVDQNYLRAPQLEQLLATQPSAHIVLPDLAIFEMTKSSKRELTLRLSLATLAKYMSRVSVSRAVGECLKYELMHAQPVTGHLLFREATHFLRRILSAIGTGVANADFERVIQDPEDHMSALERDHLDHESNKQSSLELLQATKREMTEEFAKRVRGKRATWEEKIGFVREKALNLARKRSMLLRYFYVNLWACLDWEEQGRLEGLGAAKVSNDLLDREYVLSATFFDGVLSNEIRVNDAYAAAMHLLAGRV